MNALKKISLTQYIIISMFVGILVGYFAPDFAKNLQVFSLIFIRLIKCIVAPLIFATIVVGIAGHSNMKQVGRMGWKALLYFEIVTTIALFIGLAAINITQAGKGVDLHVAEKIYEGKKEKIDKISKPKTWNEHLVEIFPENIAKAIFEGNVLQIVVFSILFGLGLIMIGSEHKKTMLQFTESMAETMFKFTGLVMYAAPIAVGSAMAYTVGTMGLDILKNLFALVATLYGALFAFILFVLVPIALFFKIKIIKLAKHIAEPVSIAFSSTSSESALPKLMTALEKFGVPRKVVSFVLPMGYSFNLDGTTLYLSLATIFVAQAAGIDLSFSEQIIMMLTLMLTSKGVAGVPRASLVILMGTAASFNLPLLPIYLIIGIDELMDMARTAVNVIGNSLATVVIAKLEGEFHEKD
ncbi:MAG: cation:dicarboxylase symporter family transporter [Bacteroidetes bacterium]|nr:cation:dicarboxylase symporter family transporter [Bacteroidota bacterium]